jgi:hypothetical protein
MKSAEGQSSDHTPSTKMKVIDSATLAETLAWIRHLSREI